MGINGAADEPLAAHVRRQFYRPSLQHRHGLPLPTPPSPARLIPSRNGRESGVVSPRYEAERKEGRKEGREEKGLWSIDAAATPPPRP